MNDDNIMSKDWIERQLTAFAAQAQAFSHRLNADPAKYAIPAEEAALLAADYEDFAANQAMASREDMRTRPAIRARDLARQRLTQRMRDIGGCIRASRAISDPDKLALTLTIPARQNKALIAVPATKPEIYVHSVINNQLNLRVKDSDAAHWAKPRYITGAEICFAVGEDAPTESGLWLRGCIALSSKAQIVLPVLPPGTKVWVCGRWFNPHGSGPISAPASARVSDAFVQPLAGRHLRAA